VHGKRDSFCNDVFRLPFSFSKLIPHSFEIHHTGRVDSILNIEAALKNDKITIEHNGKYGTPIKLEVEVNKKAIRGVYV
jgi:hypothetical protein